MVFTCMPVTVKALTIESDGVTIKGKQFYPLTGDSGNGNWKFCGLVVDENNRVHLVMANTKSTNKLDTETTLYIHYPDNPDKSFCYGHDYSGEYNDGKEHLKPSGPLESKKITNSTFNIALVDDNGQSIETKTIDAGSTQEYYFFEVGGMEFFKYGSFNVGLETKTGTAPGKGDAWDIGNPPEIGNPVEVHYDYGITKTVANDEDGDTTFENTADERITYTVTIENKSSQEDGGTGILLPIYVDYVYDYVPNGLIVRLEDNLKEDGTHRYSFAKDDAGNDIPNQLVLDTNVTLTPAGDTRTRTYTVVARIDPNFKGGVVRNRAEMTGNELVPKEDTVDVTINSYFYVHHILNDGQKGNENGVEKRIDKILFNDSLRNGAKFDVTTANSAATDYEGMLSATLYGGTFNKTEEKDAEGNVKTTYTDPYVFASGENGIDFTPEVNEHYYIWEPTDKYLRPINLAVWHTHGSWKPVNTETEYHTVAGYPITVVDRENYQEFGFVENNVIKPETIWKKVTTIPNFDYSNTNTLEAQYLGLTGYIGCYKFPETMFNTDVTDGETFLPYWVTHDGVKVTGVKERKAVYTGVGPNDKNTNDELYYKTFNVTDESNNNPVETYTVPTDKPLMAQAMFYDNSLTHPLIPEMVSADFESITAGKSGNIKALKLTLDLSKFRYDRVWFDVNGEMVEAQEMDGMISTTISSKKAIELTIIPHWTYGDREFTGEAKLLKITKNRVEDITPVVQASVNHMATTSLKTSMNFDNSSGVILQ